MPNGGSTTLTVVEPTETERYRLSEIHSWNEAVTFRIMNDLGWQEILPPGAGFLLGAVRHPFGRTLTEIDDQLTLVRVVGGLSGSAWSGPWFDAYDDEDEDPDERELGLRMLAEKRAAADRARRALPEFARTIRTTQVETLRELIVFCIDAGLIIHVGNGLMVNPYPRTPAEVSARPGHFFRFNPIPLP